MPRVIAELAPGCSIESEGAQVVELEGEKTPILLKTKDGTTLYATRDVAAAQYRWNTYHFTRSLYVVDRGQALHFRQLFKLLAQGGPRLGDALRARAVRPDPRRRQEDRHAPRQRRADARRVQDRRGRGPPGDRDGQPEPAAPRSSTTSRAKVGIGAVVFAQPRPAAREGRRLRPRQGDLARRRLGPVPQYSHARCASIVRKAGRAGRLGRRRRLRAAHPRRRVGGRGKPARLPATRRARHGRTASRTSIAHYLLELAGEFSRWYTRGQRRRLAARPRRRSGRRAARGSRSSRRCRPRWPPASACSASPPPNRCDVTATT